jgi:uncharacterized membrane protein
VPRARDLEQRAFDWYDARGARGRLVVAWLIGVLTAVVTQDFSWALRLMASWDAAAITLLGFSWWIIGRADARETRRRAGAEDPGRTAVWLVVLLSSVFSLFAGTVVLRHARDLAPRAAPALVALSLMAVCSAWVLTHTAYTLRYAHLYYRDDHDGIGGLEFPGKQPPTDVDFAYFGFTIGMCFQVSDVTITSRVIRRDVLVHAVISFAYNTAILALALNLAFGLLG